MSMDTNEAILNALRDKVARLEQVNACKDELLTNKDSQIVALRTSGERKLEHIAFLESERKLLDPEDLDSSCDYYQLYKPARRTQIEQNQKELVDADLTTAMTSLKVTKKEAQLAEAQNHSCDKEVEELVFWKGKVEQNVEVLENKQEHLTNMVDNLQAMVHQLHTTVTELEKQKAALTVGIQNMNVHVHRNTYNHNAPIATTSIAGRLDLSDGIAGEPASTSPMIHSPERLPASKSTTGTAEKGPNSSPTTPLCYRSKRPTTQGSKSHAR